jgi:hypothetical protein
MAYQCLGHRNKLLSVPTIMLLLLFTTLMASCDRCKEEDLPPPPPPLRLDFMEIEEQQYAGVLYLYGYFGDSTANSTVWFNNLEINGSSIINGTILSWDNYLIICSIPKANDVLGAGEVYVTNNESKSNERTLNRWRGTLVFHRPDEGSLARTMWMNICLRADADPRKPNSLSLAPQSRFGAGTKLQYAIGGEGSSYYTSSCIVTLTAQIAQADGWIEHDFSLHNPQSSKEEFFWSALHFQGDRFEITDIAVLKSGVSTMTMTAQSCGPVSVVSNPIDLQGLPYEFQTLQLMIDPKTKAIQAGRMEQKTSTEMGLIWDNGNVPQYDIYIAWDQIPAEL